MVADLLERLGAELSVSADGNRFLLAVPERRAESMPGVVVLNWFEELKRVQPMRSQQ